MIFDYRTHEIYAASDDTVVNGHDGALDFQVISGREYYVSRVTQSDGVTKTVTLSRFVDGNETVLLEQTTNSGSGHNGGKLEVLPNDVVVIALGDSWQPPASQQLDTTLGKLLAIRPDGMATIAARGLRSPWGLDVALEKGRWVAYVADVGYMHYEEISRVDIHDAVYSAEQSVNLGWPANRGAILDWHGRTELR